MYRRTFQRAIHRATSTFGALIILGTLSIAAAQEIRTGGVLEESYAYHRQQPLGTAGAARSIEPAGGWYGYGFPVSTFRWGWFGAAHYYPTVCWHEGYYGDCCRYAYRRGY